MAESRWEKAGQHARALPAGTQRVQGSGRPPASRSGRTGPDGTEAPTFIVAAQPQPMGVSGLHTPNGRTARTACRSARLLPYLALLLVVQIHPEQKPSPFFPKKKASDHTARGNPKKPNENNLYNFAYLTQN